MVDNFEERLYKHRIYTDNLCNICIDLINDLENRGFNITYNKYNKGKYFTFTVNNYDETFEEILLFLLQEYDPRYYGILGYYINDIDVDVYIVV